jgi:prephenate dehydratase
MPAKPIVAFQGEPGAFSEQAVLTLLGKRVVPTGLAGLADVFQAVETGKAQWGVVPIENSLGGSIAGTYDQLLASKLQIVAELGLPIVQCLLTTPGVKLRDIRRVYSHPQALAQCEKFLERQGWEAHAVYDTAGAAKLVATQDPKNGAAIASRRAADIYKLAVQKEGIQDSRMNVTRFVQIGREGCKRSGTDRTSIVFTTKDTPGALWKVLSIFAIRDINLKKLESRPSKERPFDYVFYVDLDGHTSDEPVARSLEHVREVTHYVKILGSYPAKC